MMGEPPPEAAGHIDPETPGRPAVLNPFESPNDYHRLHESVVVSPSVFNSSRCSSATPAKFKWTIDEMASLLPVEIDPEDIQRQSLYLSQTRTDKEIEEKRQHAIDQFFTKDAIVPSPWAAPFSKQSAQIHAGVSLISPGISEEKHVQGKSNVTCQTLLTLPVDFNLEKILGDYYKTEEVSEQVQETLSSSSLRRKLFLDGNGSGSESSTPSSPERSPIEGLLERSGAPVSVVSPLQCGAAVLTPSSGQFSSSPIQGRGRAYSLGSMASPMFPEKSSPNFKSPMLSPIIVQYVKTPMSGERKKLIFQTPDGMALSSSNIDVSYCKGSPFVEGCSPIKSCSPVQRRACGWLLPHYRTSPLQLSPPIFEDKENVHPSDGLSIVESKGCPTLLATPSGRCEDALGSMGGLCEKEMPAPSLVPMEDMGINNTVNMGEVTESREDYGTWAGDGVESIPLRLTSSRTGSLLNAENSHMYVSMLAEGSTIPYDCSMQVDSGYNTYSVPTNSTMDGVSSESQTKEVLGHASEEAFSHTKNNHIKTKVFNAHH
ncbi:protein aurora borealis [Scleropages formosus]|uniref:protein aurora borealis n=1 Tax=Scleropages formosus TaxID=113540 RepID=UPI000878F673|nr:protein aurora borealis [Scleropages formosus]XP_029112802.1 protein aurora borealis [Scleropages formosus]